MLKSKNIPLIVASFILLSCNKTEFDEYEVTNGSANFSNFVSVGDSYTQGLQDGGLHNEFAQQANSIPAIIAKQMNTPFVQPLVSGTGSGYMHLAYRNGKIEVIKAYNSKITDNDPEAINYDPSYNTWADTTIRYNNLAIGGLNVRNVLSTNITQALEYHVYLGTTHPSQGVLAWNGVGGQPINSYGRFLNFGNITNRIEYIEHVKRSNATFFINWLGVNDAMSWAKNGGDDVSGSSAQTNPVEFKTKYDSVLSVFNSMGAKGICATIHDFTKSPMFTTVTLEKVKKDIWFKEGADTTIIRKATTEDLILLSASSLIGKGDGLTQSNPLPHQQVLDKNEIIETRNHIAALNAQIYASAASHGFPVLDMNVVMEKLVKGINFDGIAMSAVFIEGGAFSLDGLHTNNRGNAIIANEFINSINSNFGSTLRPVIVGNYRGITFP